MDSSERAVCKMSNAVLVLATVVVLWLSVDKSWVIVIDINQSECKSSKLADI